MDGRTCEPGDMANKIVTTVGIISWEKQWHGRKEIQAGRQRQRQIETTDVMIKEEVQDRRMADNEKSPWCCFIYGLALI